MSCLLNRCQSRLDPDAWQRAMSVQLPLRFPEAGSIVPLGPLCQGHSLFYFPKQVLWCFSLDFCASVNNLHCNYSFSPTDRLFAQLDKIGWCAVTAQSQDILWWWFSKASFDMPYRLAPTLGQPTLAGWLLQWYCYRPAPWLATDRMPAP